MNNSYLIITSIDSVLIQSQYRKRYNFNFSSFSYCFPNSSSYIEGIGNIDQGLFGFYWYYFERSHFLSCFEDNNIQYPDSNGCAPTGINELTLEHNLKIYPNPTSTKVTIETNLDENFNISLLDISGKTIYNNTSKSNYLTLDVSNYPKGLYLIKIESKKAVYTSKVSVQ